MLDLERHGDVAVVHQRDGENRFNQDSIAAWHDVLDQLDAVEGPLALVTTGEGKFYSNGLDLDWMQAHPERTPAAIEEVHRLFGRVLGFAGITVAAVNGHAFGGGAILASVHDYAVMREDRGYWCMPEVDLGIALSVKLHAAVTARLPAGAAHEALVTARRYGGRDAAAAGIVHDVAPEDQVLARAVELAARHAGKDRSVIAKHKRLSYGATLDLLGATRP